MDKPHTHYAPTIRVTTDDLVKFWLNGYRWPNGEVIAVKSVTHELNHDGTAVWISPISDSPTPEQLTPHTH